MPGTSEDQRAGWTPANHFKGVPTASKGQFLPSKDTSPLWPAVCSVFVFAFSKEAGNSDFSA